eukprot:4551288-Prymnesium_polylepis.1
MAAGKAAAVAIEFPISPPAPLSPPPPSLVPSAEEQAGALLVSKIAAEAAADAIKLGHPEMAPSAAAVAA